MMVSFVLSFFPRDVLDEILNLIESVSEDFPSYSLLFDAPSSAERFRDGRTAYCSCRYPNAYVVIPSGAIHRLVSSGESVVLLIVRP